MVTLLFNILITLSAIAIGTNMHPDMFDIILFRTGTIALFMASMLEKPKRELSQNAKDIISALLILIIFNIFINTFNPIVLSNSMNLFLFIIMATTLYRYYNPDGKLKYFIATGVIINIVMFLSQQLGFNPIADIPTYAGQSGAFFGNKQRLATYIAITVPFLADIHPFLMIIPLIMAKATDQTIILLALIITMMYLSRNKPKRLIIQLLIVSIALIWKYPRIIQSLSFRFNNAWKHAILMFFDRPFLGYGIGIQQINGMDFIGNSYLQFIVGTGIMGVLWIIYALKKLIADNTNLIYLIVLAAVAFFEYPIELPRLWITIAAIVTIPQLKKGETNVS